MLSQLMSKVKDREPWWQNNQVMGAHVEMAVGARAPGVLSLHGLFCWGR